MPPSIHIYLSVKLTSCQFPGSLFGENGKLYLVKHTLQMWPDVHCHAVRTIYCPNGHTVVYIVQTPAFSTFGSKQHAEHSAGAQLTQPAVTDTYYEILNI